MYSTTMLCKICLCRFFWIDSFRSVFTGSQSAYVGHERARCSALLAIKTKSAGKKRTWSLLSDRQPQMSGIYSGPAPASCPSEASVAETVEDSSELPTVVG